MEYRTAGSKIDWVAIRERLDRLAQIVSGENERTPEQALRVLKERARALSKPILATPMEEAVEVLTFNIAGERYAVESRYVFASLRLEHLAPVPAAEPPLVGLTAWRGELLTLFDLRIVTGTSAHALSDLGWVVVLGDTSASFGVLVDELQSIVRLPLSEIRPVHAGLSARREYVGGITNEAMLVLDAPELIRTYT